MTPANAFAPIIIMIIIRLTIFHNLFHRKCSFPIPNVLGRRRISHASAANGRHRRKSTKYTILFRNYLCISLIVCWCHRRRPDDFYVLPPSASQQDRTVPTKDVRVRAIAFIAHNVNLFVI